MGQKVSTAASRPRAPRGGRERVPLSSPAALLVPPLGAPSVNHGQPCPCLRLFLLGCRPHRCAREAALGSQISVVKF